MILIFIGKSYLDNQQKSQKKLLSSGCPINSEGNKDVYFHILELGYIIVYMIDRELFTWPADLSIQNIEDTVRKLKPSWVMKICPLEVVTASHSTSKLGGLPYLVLKIIRFGFHMPLDTNHSTKCAFILNSLFTRFFIHLNISACISTYVHTKFET